MHYYLELSNTDDIDFGIHKYCCALFPLLIIFQGQHRLTDPNNRDTLDSYRSWLTIACFNINCLYWMCILQLTDQYVKGYMFVYDYNWRDYISLFVRIWWTLCLGIPCSLSVNDSINSWSNYIIISQNNVCLYLPINSLYPYFQ